MIVDFDKNIIALSTNRPGHQLDATCVRRNYLFKEICNNDGQNFALGDPGFQNVDYVVAGLKCNMSQTVGGREFTRVTKKEQIVVEHDNSFI